MRTKEEVLRDAFRLIKEKNSLRERVDVIIERMKNPESISDEEIVEFSTTMSTINERLEEIVGEMGRLAIEARDMRKQMNDFDIIG